MFNKCVFPSLSYALSDKQLFVIYNLKTERVTFHVILIKIKEFIWIIK